jgi:lipid-A-disaccharide synthase
VRIALTSNGPGEFSGWVRPLVATLRRLAPQTQIALFFVPDDYATGREDEVARRLFPDVAVFAARDYLRFALGRPLAGAPSGADAVLYLGGDLMHAARVRARLGGALATYKFSSRRLRKSILRAYAVDAKNAAALARSGLGGDRTEIVGNLAVDGALAEAAGIFGGADRDRRIAPGGVLVLPGSRKYEIEHLVPFFVQVALKLRAIAPDLPVAFAISPFTDAGELDRALKAGGHPRVWGARGSVVDGPDGLWLQPAGEHAPIPVVRDAMRYAPLASMALTIPGTKCVELAALGVPTMVCTPLNAPELAVINGPLQYLDRVPFFMPLKRAIALQVDRSFPLAAQPNMDAGEELMPELRGTLMPGFVARRAADYAADDAARGLAAERLRALYRDHVGAAERMARSLLGLAP